MNGAKTCVVILLAFATALAPMSRLAAAQDLAPGEIQGVKWKQAPVGLLEAKIDYPLDLPAGKTKDEVAKALKANGVNAVVIRVDDVSRFNNGQPDYDRAMADIVEAVPILAKNDIAVYLWGRIWLERNGVPNKAKSVDATADSVVELFTPVLDLAKQKGVLGDIAGLALIETNVNTMASVQNYALRITEKFNLVNAWKDAKGQGFFKTRTFLVPGAGFGLDFRDATASTFLPEIQTRVKYFSFIYKFMQGKEGVLPTQPDYDSVKLSDGKIHTWAEMEANDPAFTVDLRKKYLNHFGLDKLVAYLNANQPRLPHVANLVFWGDKWDGISQIPPLTRQALYELMVVKGEALNPATKGKFFDMTAAVSNDPAQANQAIQRFSYLSADLAPNPFASAHSLLTVGQEWQAWGTEVNPKYNEPGPTP